MKGNVLSLTLACNHVFNPGTMRYTGRDFVRVFGVLQVVAVRKVEYMLEHELTFNLGGIISLGTRASRFPSFRLSSFQFLSGREKNDSQGLVRRPEKGEVGERGNE